MIRRALLVVASLALAGTFVTVAGGPAAAETYNGEVVYTCDTFTASGTGSHVLDRDNTGSNEEALRIDVYDGTGANIFTFSYENTLGSYSGGIIGTTPYATPPAANPLSFTMTSLAGNGLPEVVHTYNSGTCDEIPTVNCEVDEPVTDVADTSTDLGAAQAIHPDVCGDLVVTKTVTGSADPGTTFNVQVACTAPPVDEELPAPAALPTGHLAPFSTTLTFPEAGGSQVLHITDGANCTVTEATQPAGCSLVSITPPSVVIDVDTTQTVAVTDLCEITIKPIVVTPRFAG